jgi:PPOX class probable F420-dependent enzyme
LRRELPIWLTTVTPAGQPQTSPVWFLWDGEVFHLISQPDATKIPNLEANPLVSLHLQADVTADEDVLIFEGVVAFDGDTTERDWLPAYIEKYRERIDSYGWTPEGMLAEYSVSFRVTPTRIRTS